MATSHRIAVSGIAFACILIIALSLLAALPAGPGQAQVVVTPEPVPQVSANIVSEQSPPPAPPQAPEVVLYDKYNNPGSSDVTSQNFEAAQDFYDDFAADDFVIPNGQNWIIDRVEVDGEYYTGPADSVNVIFYADNAGLPGLQLAAAMNLGFLGGLEPSDFVITISPAIVLGPGHYWMAVQANQSFTPNGQWYWRTRTVTSNSPAAWQNPGGGFGSACTSWGTRFSTCGIVGAEPDQVFRIDGKLAQGTLFCNTSPITSPDYGTASPYPSNILVAGMGISRTDVNVVLVHLSHTFPDDLDFLLVDPGGHNAMVMSDAGGGIDVTLISVTLDDQAASVLPDIAALTAGSFQPANYVTDDPFPPPAPALSGAVNLSTFNGTDPNGTWSLYLWDDQHGDLGSINGGWCLDITASGGKVYLPTVLNAGL